MKEKTPITIVRKGEIIGIFASQRDAARVLGVHATTIANRISRASVTDECTFRYATDEETAVLHTLARIARVEAEPQNPRPKPEEKKPERKRVYKSDDKPLESMRGTLVSYDITPDRRCVTPCPYRDAPKPMVGSAGCARCPSFHGRNRQLRKVACSFRKKSLM